VDVWNCFLVIRERADRFFFVRCCCTLRGTNFIFLHSPGSF